MVIHGVRRWTARPSVLDNYYGDRGNASGLNRKSLGDILPPVQPLHATASELLQDAVEGRQVFASIVFTPSQVQSGIRPGIGDASVDDAGKLNAVHVRRPAGRRYFA